MSKPLTIAYSDIYLDWKLGAGDGSHPTNPILDSGDLLELEEGNSDA